METESVRISKDVMKKLRKHIIEKMDGKVYGKISETVEKAIKEYLDREESYQQIGTETLEDRMIILEAEAAKLRTAIREIHRLSEPSLLI